MNYDRNFKSYFGTEARNAMRSVINLAGAIFQHRSLTTKIKLKILQTRYVKANFELTNYNT